MKTEVIETERLVLKPFLVIGPKSEYPSWLNDPEVVRYSRQRFQKHTKETCEEYLRSFDHIKNHIWAIHARNGDVHIGNITAHRNNTYGTIEIGILMGNRAYWGKRLGLEAWEGVLNHLRTHEEDIIIRAGCHKDNLPMKKILQRTMIYDSAHGDDVLYWKPV